MKNKLFQVIQKNLFHRKVLVFAACIFIAAFSWLINVLNRNYTKTLKVQLVYQNFPDGKTTSTLLPEFINTEIKTSGTKLLFLLIKQNINKVKIDVAPLIKYKNKQVGYIQTSQAIGNLSQQLGTEIELIRLKPDTLFFNFGKSFSKLVPIKANVELDYEKLYHLSEGIKITPGLIQVNGDSAVIASMDSLETEKIILNKLNRTVEQEVGILIPEKHNGRIILKNTKVKVLVQVDKFTEAEREIPVIVENLPIGYKLRTFPDKVKIRYHLPMGNYESISDSDFVASVNYRDTELKKDKLKVSISTSRPSIKITSCSPEKIEYLIKK